MEAVPVGIRYAYGVVGSGPSAPAPSHAG